MQIEIGDHRLTTQEIQDLLVTDHPLVAQFRFELQSQSPGNLNFALHIIPRAGARYQQQRDARGARVRPASGTVSARPQWRTLTGSETVGQGNRAIWLEGDDLVAENCTFFPNQEFNDLGIGSALYVSMERFYRHLGIRRVTLLAVDVGVYVWARQGFRFSERSATRDLFPLFSRFVREQSVSVAKKDFQHSWDFANYDVEGLSDDGYRLGKSFMLNEAPPWYGEKYLDDEVCTRIAEASRRETFSHLPEKIEGAPAELAVN